MPDRPKSPFIDADVDERRKAKAKYAGMSIAKVRKERNEQQDLFDKAYTEYSESDSLEDVEAVAGSDAEKVEALTRINSRITAANEVLKDNEADTQNRQVVTEDVEKLFADYRNSNNGGAAVPTTTDSDIRSLVEQILESKNAPKEKTSLYDRGNQIIQSEYGYEYCSSDFVKNVKSGGLNYSGDYAQEVLNADFLTSAGWAPESLRDTGYTPYHYRPIEFISILPQLETDQTAVKFMREKVGTNAAKGTTEVETAPESVAELEEITADVIEVSHHIPVSNWVLEDVPEVQSYIDFTIPYNVMRKSDSYAMSGSGSSGQPTGLLNTTGIQTDKFTHKSGGKVLEKPLNTLRKSRTKIEHDGYSIPTHFVINPSTWDDIVLSESASGGYYYGRPENNFQEVCWSLPVVRSKALTDATTADTVNAVVGGFLPMWVQLRMRTGFETAWGFATDDFLKGRMSVRGTVRFAMVVKRPVAFAAIKRPA